MPYDWIEIEQKWQKIWCDMDIAAPSIDSNKKKYYGIFAYPSPSSFLHIGQLRGYTLLDMFLRLKRMQNYNVYFPCGTHATGIPSYGFVKKLESGNSEILKNLNYYGVNEETLKKLHSPAYAAEFLGESYKKSWKAFGMLVDTDSYAITISRGYNKFIEWQFRTLYKSGYLVQKPHFAPYCPNCGPVAVDPSESDLSRGGNAEMMEYTLIFFRTEDGFILPAATLRPETIFGVTNLWIREDAKYVIAEVGSMNWIIAMDSAEKFINQFDAKIVASISSRDIQSKKVKTPFTGNVIAIYESNFVEPGVGSGVVMSVPSDAPYDLVAVKDKSLDIDPIPIIRVEGYDKAYMGVFNGDLAAVNGVRSWNIESLADIRLEELTKLIYKIEYHNGILYKNCGEYNDCRISEVKDKIIDRLIKDHNGDKLYEFDQQVVCRCGTTVIIKKIRDQWFINYHNERIKNLTKEHIKKMTILPDEYKEELQSIIDWYDDRACTRKGNWLGTRFPMDSSWIIEPIADSTLYPAFYIVSRYINRGMINVEDLDDEFFDAVFLGKAYKGRINDKDLVKKIGKEFNYWYPLDLNAGGKEHKRVHFPVFLMMHTMVFDEHKLPDGLFVHWWVTERGGVKISKSKGGDLPFVLDAPKIYSADAMRMFYASVTPFSDLEWNETDVINFRNRLSQIWEFITGNNQHDDSLHYIDQWFERMIKRMVRIAEQHLINMKFREAMNIIYYNYFDAFEWYYARGGNNSTLIKFAKDTVKKMMLPITPHIAEELWSLNHDTILSTESYPSFEYCEENEIEYGELYIKRIYSDIAELIKLIGKKIEKVNLYIADEWKYGLYREMVDMFVAGRTPKISDFISRFTDVPGKKAAKQISAMIEFARHSTPVIDEYFILTDAMNLLERKLDVKITIIKGSDGNYTGSKKGEAIPLRPAIHIQTE